MPCYHPLRAYRGPAGRIEFSRKRGFADRPLDLPCGQCIGCRITKSREWALRCMHEAQLHEQNCFITLTYSPQQLPATGSLSKEHWQLFAKRLRKRKGSVRYLACGEYGELNLRPHYHAALFGLDFSEDRQLLQIKNGNPVYISRTLSSIWGMGFCSIGALTYQSAAYIARYTLKKQTGDRAATAYERVDPDTGEVFSVLPEFAFMSRRPGLGSDWYEQFKSDVFPHDEVVHKGKRSPAPRYYLNKLEKSDPSLHLQIKAKRQAAKRPEKSTLDRLEAGEIIEESKWKTFKREV